MEILKLLVEILKIIIWPVVAIFAIIKFKEHIAALIARINEAKMGGVEIKMERKLEAKIEEATDAIIESRNKGESNSAVTNEIVKQVMEEMKTSIISSGGVTDNVMLAFAVKQSIKENIEYNIYYDPVDRNHNTPFKYVGLYNEQSIKYVAIINKIVKCNLVDGQLIGTHGEDINKLTEKEKMRIINTIKNAEFDTYQNHKFYLVENFYPTEFRKSTPYGIMSKKYFWLDEIPGFKPGMSAEQLAELLKGKTWE